LQRIVAVKLEHDWPPQQIAGWLKEHFPGHPEMWVSHETIYRSLFVRAGGALKKSSSATCVQNGGFADLKAKFKLCSAHSQCGRWDWDM
jgi:IS30 family transposase